MKRIEEVFRDNPPGLRDRLRECRAGIAGCGGIGSNVALLLARAGVGSLVLVDFDRVEERNLNRQSYFKGHIGMPKVEALRQQILDIGPRTRVKACETRIVAGNAVSLFKGCHILIEALDSDESKEMVLTAWLSSVPDVPVVACSGVAGLGDPGLIRVDRRRMMTVVGDGESQLDLGTLSARVCLVAATMALEAVRVLAGQVPQCDSCPSKCHDGVRLTCNGQIVPLAGFPARALEGAILGMLSTYRGVDTSGEIRVTLGNRTT